MEQTIIQKLESSIKKLEDKTSRIYFMVQDTKGNARASVRMIYQAALSLKNAGFNPIILHEKADYVGVSSWLEGDYMSIPHKVIEGQNLEISPEDFIVIPEIFGFVMEQVKNLPCGKIVFTQAYDHVLETLQPGQSWSQCNFTKCITTSEQQKSKINELMRNTSIDVVYPTISEVFTKKTLPAKPIIGVHTRDQRESLKLIKSFYLTYPQYRWVTFRDLRGLSESEFANSIKDCFLCVWIDPTSGFGTFPLECMKTGTPVIGQIPHLIPEWLNENNGIWIQNPNQILNFVADFLQNWLEDNLNPELFTNMEETAKQYSDIKKMEQEFVELFKGYCDVRLSTFKEQLNKLQTNN